MKIANIYIIIFFSSYLFSQGLSSISGFVRDDTSGEPISYANVFLSNSTLGAATNQDGYFVISNIPVGKYELNATMIGYGIFKNNIELSEGQPIRLDIRLNEEIIQTTEVLVTAERQKFERSMESSQISLDIREINSAPAFIEPDVFRTLQMLPGVQTTSDFSSALYVRGSTPDQNLIMLDGIAVYNPYHLGGIFSTFNTDAIKEADFHAGGFPARYGGRMGAILNVLNREGNTRKVKGSANISLISSKGLIEGPLPSWRGMKGSWMISGRRTYFDTVIDALKIPIGQRIDGSDIYFQFPYYFYDYQVKINLDIDQDHRLTYSRFYGDDIVDFSFEETLESSGTNVNVKSETGFGVKWPWGNHTNGLTWRWIIAPDLVAKTFFSHSRYRFDFELSAQDRNTYTYTDSTIELFSDVTFRAFDIIKDNTIETALTWQAAQDHTVTGGFQVKDVNFDLGLDISIATQDTSLDFSLLSLVNNTREIAFFAQDKWDFSEKLKFQFGLRSTHYNLHNNIYFDPRMSMK